MCFREKQELHVTYLCEENKSIKLQTFVTFGTLIIEFEMSESQRKTPQNSKPS